MMTFRILLIASIAVAASAAGFGCYTGSPVDTNRSANGAAPSVSTDGTDPSSEQGGEAGSANNAVDAPTGIPCDVAAVLTNNCAVCHGATPSHGAPNRLLSYDDLSQKSDDDPTQTVAQVSLVRMQSTKRPMPPDGNLADDQVMIFQKWVQAGLPMGSCGEPSTKLPDGGTTSTNKDGGASGSLDAGVGDASAVCTSKSFYDPDAGVGEEMHPGKTCLSCHAAQGAKTFFIAGTVFPTIHEPDDCNGSSQPNTSVVLIDATGVTHTVAVNDVGNFMRITSIPLPYRAMIIRGSAMREMHTPQTDGDCNGCHSEWGTKSPGRIMAP